MKKKLTYRDKLIELAYIYNVREIQEYIKRRKNLTTGQIELILKKNKIVIPKEFNTSFFKENISKPISKFKSNLADYKEEKIKDKNKFFRRVENYKHDTSRKINLGFLVLVDKTKSTKQNKPPTSPISLFIYSAQVLNRL